MALEVEARFRADGTAPLELLAAVETLGPATLGPVTSAVEEDRYLDTADGRLAEARWACRLRLRGGETRISLKGPPDVPADGWLHRRPEVEGPATAEPDPARWPPSEARALLLTLSGGAPLVERLHLVQTRAERNVRIGGRAVGVLTLDTVRVVAGANGGEEMHLVELELRGDHGTEEHLASLADALAAIEGLVPEPLTKLELALERV